MTDMLARRVMATRLRARSDARSHGGQEIIDWRVLTMADDEVVDGPGHGLYQTRSFERDPNRGRIAR